MAERKQTPDVLAELLSAELGGAAPAPAPAPPATKGLLPDGAATRAHTSRELKAQTRPVQQVAAPLWEDEVVSFQEHRGWRPRYVNGVELKGWLAEPLVHDYVNHRGEQGWELAASSSRDHFYGAADGLQLYFKRRK